MYVRLVPDPRFTASVSVVLAYQVASFDANWVSLGHKLVDRARRGRNAPVPLTEVRERQIKPTPIIWAFVVRARPCQLLYLPMP